MNEPIGRRGSLRSARDRLKLSYGDDRFVLADDLAFQLVFHFQEFLRFFLFHALERHPGPLRHDMHDVLAGDDHFVLIARFAPLA